jgi:hypothetical protein
MALVLGGAWFRLVGFPLLQSTFCYTLQPAVFEWQILYFPLVAIQYIGSFMTGGVQLQEKEGNCAGGSPELT